MANNPLNASKILFDPSENQKAIADYQQLLKNWEATALQAFNSVSAKSKKASSEIDKLGKTLLELVQGMKAVAGQADVYDPLLKKTNELTLVLQALKKIEKEANVEREVAKKTLKEVNALNKDYTKNLKALEKENAKVSKQLTAMTKKYDAQNKAQKAADNSIEKLKLETKEAEKVFKLMENSLGGTSKEVLEAKNKFLLLKSELTKTNAEIRQNVKTVDVAKNSYRSWEAIVNKASKELKELDPDLKKNAKRVRELTKAINDNRSKLKKFDASIGNFQRNVGNYSSALKGVGLGAAKMAGALGLALGATELLARGVTFAFEKFTAFEFSMASVKAITGATASEFKSLESDAKRLGASTKFTADAVAGLQLQYAKAGYSANEIIEATEATLNLAEATGEDLAGSASVASDTLKGFGLDASQTARVTDVMAKSFTSSKLDLEKFRESMKLIAPIAKTAGISIERATADVGKLADVGISGSSAGTALRKVYSEMATEGSKLSKQLGFTVKNSDDASKAFKLLAKQGIGLGEAQKLVGVNAKSAFLALIENAEGADKLTNSLENSAGSARAMANVMRDTLQGSLDGLNSAAEGLAITLFDSVDGAFRGIVDTLTEVLQGVNAFFGGIEQGIQTQERFTKSISDEKAQIEFLFASLNNSNLSHKERLEVVDKINTQFGEYLPNLTKETDSHLENAVAQDLVIKGKIKELILIREKDQIEAILVKRIEAQQRLAKAKLVIDRDVAIQAKERNKQANATIDGVFKSSGVISKVDEAASAVSLEMQKVNEEAAKATQEVKDLNNQLRKIEGIEIPKDGIIDPSSNLGVEAGKVIGNNISKGISESDLVSKLQDKLNEFVSEFESDQELQLKAGLEVDNDAFNKFSKSIKQKAQDELDAQNAVIKIGLEFDKEDFAAEDALEEKQSQLFLKRKKEQEDAKKERLKALSLEQQAVNNFSSFLKRNIKDEKIRLAIELARLAASFRIAKLRQKETGQTGLPDSVKNLSFLNGLKIPGFAKGVIDLKGAGTGTSDSITANLSAGESVTTAARTKTSKGILEGIRDGRITDMHLPTLEAKQPNMIQLERKLVVQNQRPEIDYNKLASKIGVEVAKNMPKTDIVEMSGYLAVQSKTAKHLNKVAISSRSLNRKT